MIKADEVGWKRGRDLGNYCWRSNVHRRGPDTYDDRSVKIGHPVRSAIYESSHESANCTTNSTRLDYSAT
jgi:hypothetical protein